MRWRVLVWGAVVIAAAAAAGLALDVTVVGTGKAAALAGVIAGFCELAALVLGVFAWAGQRRAAAASREEKETSPVAAARDDSGGADATQAGVDTKYVVDARRAAGVQVGEGNTQHVVSRRPSPGT
jgi:type VI protein secretion system component VasK